MRHIPDKFTRGFLNIDGNTGYNTNDKVSNIVNGQKSYAEGLQEPTWLGFYIKFDFTETGKKNNINSIVPGLLLPENDLDGAVHYLRRIGYDKSAACIREFSNQLENIEKYKPWYFQKISGLNELWKMPESGKVSRKRDVELTIETLETADLQMTFLADLYRKGTFDWGNVKNTLPGHMKRFSFQIVVCEIRDLYYVSALNEELIDESMSDKTNTKRVSAIFKELDSQISYLIFNCTGSFIFDMLPYTDSISMGEVPKESATNSFKIKVATVAETNQYGFFDWIISNTDINPSKNSLAFNIASDFNEYKYGENANNYKLLFAPKITDRGKSSQNKKRDREFELSNSENIVNDTITTKQQKFGTNYSSLSEAERHYIASRVSNNRKLNSSTEIDPSNPTNVIQVSQEINFNIYAATDGKAGANPSSLESLQSKHNTRLGESVYDSNENSIQSKVNADRNFRYMALQRLKNNDTWSDIVSTSNISETDINKKTGDDINYATLHLDETGSRRKNIGFYEEDELMSSRTSKSPYDILFNRIRESDNGVGLNILDDPSRISSSHNILGDLSNIDKNRNVFNDITIHEHNINPISVNLEGADASKTPNPLTLEGAKPLTGPNPLTLEGAKPLTGPNPLTLEGAKPLTGPNPLTLEGAKPLTGPNPLTLEGAKPLTGPNPLTLEGADAMKTPNPLTLEGADAMKTPNPLTLEGAKPLTGPNPLTLEGADAMKTPNPLTLEGAKPLTGPNQIEFSILTQSELAASNLFTNSTSKSELGILNILANDTSKSELSSTTILTDNTSKSELSASNLFSNNTSKSELSAINVLVNDSRKMQLTNTELNNIKSKREITNLQFDKNVHNNTISKSIDVKKQQTNTLSKINILNEISKNITSNLGKIEITKYKTHKITQSNGKNDLRKRNITQIKLKSTENIKNIIPLKFDKKKTKNDINSITFDKNLSVSSITKINLTGNAKKTQITNISFENRKGNGYKNLGNVTLTTSINDKNASFGNIGLTSTDSRYTLQSNIDFDRPAKNETISKLQFNNIVQHKKIDKLIFETNPKNIKISNIDLTGKSPLKDITKVVLSGNGAKKSNQIEKNVNLSGNPKKLSIEQSKRERVTKVTDLEQKHIIFNRINKQRLSKTSLFSKNVNKHKQINSLKVSSNLKTKHISNQNTFKIAKKNKLKNNNMKFTSVAKKIRLNTIKFTKTPHKTSFDFKHIQTTPKISHNKITKLIFNKTPIKTKIDKLTLDMKRPLTRITKMDFLKIRPQSSINKDTIDETQYRKNTVITPMSSTLFTYND